MRVPPYRHICLQAAGFDYRPMDYPYLKIKLKTRKLLFLPVFTPFSGNLVAFMLKTAATILTITTINRVGTSFHILYRLSF